MPMSYNHKTASYKQWYEAIRLSEGSCQKIREADVKRNDDIIYLVELLTEVIPFLLHLFDLSLKFCQIITHVRPGLFH